MPKPPRTGMEHSRNTAGANSAPAPTFQEMERIAASAELSAVRREYKQLLQLCNAIQLSFIALARALNVTPDALATFISQEQANRGYEADAVRELGRIRNDLADKMKRVASS